SPRAVKLQSGSVVRGSGADSSCATPLGGEAVQTTAPDPLAFKEIALRGLIHPPFRWKGVDGHDASTCLPPSLAKGEATTADWIGSERRQPARRASAKDGASKRTRAQRERGTASACACSADGSIGTRRQHLKLDQGAVGAAGTACTVCRRRSSCCGST